jgi:CRISPR-associated protein Csb1
MATREAVRRVFTVELAPGAGSRFQPTGFPDIGAALFQRPVGDNWEQALLVESAQSVANRLEGTAWDDATQAPVELFAPLPYVRVVDDAGYVTSSRTDSHRLASAFVKDSALDGTSMIEVIKQRLGIMQDRPFALRDIAPAIFALDPFSLIHGVFFADKQWPGQPKVARAVTGFIEAHGVQRADSGGVKRDNVRHSIDEGQGGSTEGYGSVPFHRVEWVARTIQAFFSLDLAQLRSYGLGPAATELLEAIALWEIRTFLDGPLRLRSACELMPVDDDVPGLPSASELEEQIRTQLSLVADLIPQPGPIEVRWDGGKKKPKA